MLLRFKVENFKSLYREQEFSMVPEKSKAGESALSVALIYGPNASGKSNLVSALKFLTEAVSVPFRSETSRFSHEAEKFKLAKEAENQASQFEVDFEIEGVRYNYGFISSGGIFLEEWLFGFFSKRPSRLFERRIDAPIQFGESLRGSNREVEKLANQKQLYLSLAGIFQHEQLLPIWKFFSQSMFVSDNPTRAMQVAALLGRRGKIDSRIIEFLDSLQTGVKAHRFEKRTRQVRNAFVNQGSLFADVDGPPTLRNVEDRWLELGHASDTEAPVYFDPSLESSGTGRLLFLLDRTFNCLDKGLLLVVDEIDLSLHSLACLAIVQLFNDSNINTKGAQLVATTHDTNLICSPQLGRDQIWFAEKNANGATEIYPLSDFKVRENDNFERGYLRGRFGALPFAGDPAELFRSMRVNDDEKV